MSDLAWETLSSTVDYECPGFDVREDRVRLPDGTETAFHYLAEPPAVVVLPFTPDGDVVTIREWRQAVGRTNHSIPAGTVEAGDGDDLEAAAARELAEETGYEAGSFEHLATVEPSNGLANSVHHHFVARDCEPAGDPALDENESIDVQPRPYEEFREAVLSGDVRDGRAVLAVSRFEAA